MKKLNINSFDTNKIGDSKQLSQIIGGGTYKHSGHGSNAGGTYVDYAGDGGNKDQCDVPDGTLPGGRI